MNISSITSLPFQRTASLEQSSFSFAHVSAITSVVTAVALLAFGLLKAGIACLEIAAILIALREIKPIEEPEQTALLAMMPSIITGMSSSQKNRLVTLLSHLEAPIGLQLMTDTCRLVTDKVSFHKKVDIAEALHKIAPPLRAQLIPVVLSLLPNKLNIFEKLDVMRSLNQIEAHFRTPQLIRDACLLITDAAEASSIDSTIKSLHKIEETVRSELMTEANRLFSAHMTMQDKLSVVKTLSKIEASKRSALVTCVLLLVANMTHPFGIASLVKELNQIKQPRRLQLVADIQSLTLENMNGFEKAILVKVLGKVDKAMRPSLITAARLLITPAMSAREIAFIIEALRDIEPSYQSQLIVDSLRLIPQEIALNERIHIMLALHIIRDKKREHRCTEILSQLDRDEATAIKFDRCQRVITLLETPLDEPFPSLKGQG